MAYVAANGAIVESRLSYASPHVPRGVGSYCVATPYLMAEFAAIMLPLNKRPENRKVLRDFAVPFVLDSLHILETGGFND